ncbi:MAG TPA: hypothetical protein VGN68_16180 [Sphingopyxis sp.]|jgi:hypothetical protein|uniref:hypothetical protein n=1 Tax=Sphingopyxis sp. TaxID=1908224 RepID=UPI002E0D1C9D|nr:hypothetical protein [Sphingopyxis sp.]
MTNIRVSMFACEDIRWEANGTPMILGLMSPIFHPVEYPLTMERMHVVTIIRISKEISEITAKLTMKWDRKSNIVDEEKSRSFSVEYSRNEDDNDLDFDWSVFSNLALDNLEFDEGDILEFKFEAGDCSDFIKIKAGSLMEIES